MCDSKRNRHTGQGLLLLSSRKKCLKKVGRKTKNVNHNIVLFCVCARKIQCSGIRTDKYSFNTMVLNEIFVY